VKRDGGLLIVALVAVAVVTMLALALGAWVRSQGALLEANRYRRDVRRETFNAATLCVAARLADDTNGWDAAVELWSREPWERREEGWIMRVSGAGWSDRPGGTVGLTDECGKAPLNHASPALLAALLQAAASLPPDRATALALRIVDWRDEDELVYGSEVTEEAAYGAPEHPWQAPNRPFGCVEELAAVPGIAPEAAAQLLPLLTVDGAGTVNLNTAPEPVLRALLRAAQADDEQAAVSLYDRLLTYRRAGFVFRASGALAVGRDLGGLPASEAALLARAEPLLAASSIAFSGVAEATPAATWAAGRKGGRAHFVWDRRQCRFMRWVEE
jgi:type II secretory pathway component PulK